MDPLSGTSTVFCGELMTAAPIHPLPSPSPDRFQLHLSHPDTNLAAGIRLSVPSPGPGDGVTMATGADGRSLCSEVTADPHMKRRDLAGAESAIYQPLHMFPANESRFEPFANQPKH
jgi:hypothetical protein